MTAWRPAARPDFPVDSSVRVMDAAGLLKEAVSLDDFRARGPAFDQFRTSERRGPRLKPIPGPGDVKSSSNSTYWRQQCEKRGVPVPEHLLKRGPYARTAAVRAAASAAERRRRAAA